MSVSPMYVSLPKQPKHTLPNKREVGNTWWKHGGMIYIELLEGDIGRRYRALLVRVLQYLVMVTHCGIAYSVNQLSRASRKLSQPNLVVAKRVLRYLKGCSQIGINAN